LSATANLLCRPMGGTNVRRADNPPPPHEITWPPHKLVQHFVLPKFMGGRVISWRRVFLPNWAAMRPNRKKYVFRRRIVDPLGQQLAAGILAAPSRRCAAEPPSAFCRTVAAAAGRLGRPATSVAGLPARRSPQRRRDGCRRRRYCRRCLARRQYDGGGPIMWRLCRP